MGGVGGGSYRDMLNEVGRKRRHLAHAGKARHERLDAVSGHLAVALVVETVEKRVDLPESWHVFFMDSKAYAALSNAGIEVCRRMELRFRYLHRGGDDTNKERQKHLQNARCDFWVAFMNGA